MMVGLSEDEYIALVERIQRAMCLEPFQPDVTDVVVLIGTCRTLDHEIKRLRIELHRVSERALHLPTKQEQEIERLRAFLQEIAETAPEFTGVPDIARRALKRS